MAGWRRRAAEFQVLLPPPSSLPLSLLSFPPNLSILRAAGMGRAHAGGDAIITMPKGYPFAPLIINDVKAMKYPFLIFHNIPILDIWRVSFCLLKEVVSESYFSHILWSFCFNYVVMPFKIILEWDRSLHIYTLLQLVGICFLMYFHSP